MYQLSILDGVVWSQSACYGITAACMSWYTQTHTQLANVTVIEMGEGVCHSSCLVSMVMLWMAWIALARFELATSGRFSLSQSRCPNLTVFYGYFWHTNESRQFQDNRNDHSIFKGSLKPLWCIITSNNLQMFAALFIFNKGCCY